MDVGLTNPWDSRRGISEALRIFTAELPLERAPILDFVMSVAAGTPAGASVLDLGAGDAPYRELFRHTRYVTADWAQSLHAGARSADIVASAESIPMADASFDLILCTQVLEHVPEPASVLRECHRLLGAGGRLALTAPLLWELHELPHDYYRYTSAGLRYLVEEAGFADIEVAARSDGFAALAQLMINLRWSLRRESDGLDDARDEAARLLTELSGVFAGLGPLDTATTMPLGYSVRARRPHRSEPTD